MNITKRATQTQSSSYSMRTGCFSDTFVWVQNSSTFSSIVYVILGETLSTKFIIAVLTTQHCFIRRFTSWTRQPLRIPWCTHCAFTSVFLAASSSNSSTLFNSELLRLPLRKKMLDSTTVPKSRSFRPYIILPKGSRHLSRPRPSHRLRIASHRRRCRMYVSVSNELLVTFARV